MSPFSIDIFSENKTTNGFKRVTGIDLLRVLRDTNTWLKMLDEDVVQLCLLIASELVFMGKEKRNFLTKHIMWLVDDFDSWNAFPWDINCGELPKQQKWWSKKANMIPRGFAWSKVTKFEKSDYDCLFGPLSIPNVVLISSPEEMRQAWFMASVDFIKRLADQDGNFLPDDEARVNCIKHNNRMFGDTEVGKFLQDEEARVNGIEHHNGMCFDTKDSNFVEGIDETICPKTNQMSVEEGDGGLDSEGDDVHLSQTNDVIQQAKCKDDDFDELTKRFSKLETSQTFVMFKNLLKTDVCNENESTDLNPKKSEDMPNFCSNHSDTSSHIGGLSTEAMPSSSSSHPGNEKDASHLDDLMEIDGENIKDGYTNSQHHLHLLNKALESKTENPTLDVVVLPKDDDCILCTIKPNDAYNVVESIDKKTLHKKEYGIRVNERQMQTIEEKFDTSKALDASLVDIESRKPCQFMNEKSNEAKVKHDIDVTETINIELEHKVAKLLNENKTLKKHYKELFDSIKIMRAKTIKHTTSLIATNDNFKAQLQEKGLAIAALKNELRKLTGNSVNTKFAKPSILGKPVLQPNRNQSVVRQPNAFKSERPRILKPRFATQVDVNKDLSKPAGVFNANHDACVTKLLNDINSRAKVPSHKTTNKNKPIKKTSVPKKPDREISIGHRFSIKKTTTVNEKIMTSRSCLRWKPTGKIFKIIGLRWVSTGKIFTSSTTKVDSEFPNGSNEDITNPYECEQTLDVSAGTLHLSADLMPQRQEMYVDNVSSDLFLQGLKASDYDNSGLVPQRQNVVPPADKADSSQQMLECFFNPLFKEYYTSTNANAKENNDNHIVPKTWIYCLSL
uniref:Phospholipase-like protein n=1 Tax=Tanacetum cinerariifolium TaxID=118510 RepID=A0A6L2MG27_TANCI|nr:hypothetical protein [Tanacetum cinerariifolium]GEU96711.1 hypothetical protein [Tanacetum cinerariifolium]